MKNIKVLITEFQEGKYLNLLKDIYIDDNILEYQNNRYITALEKFKEIYGDKEVEIEQNRCAMARLGCGAVFYFLEKQ